MGNNHSPMVYSTPLTNYDPEKHETPIYRRAGHEHHLIDRIPDTPGVSTLQSLYQRTFKEYAKRNAVGTRPKDKDGKLGEYQFKTYEEVEGLAMKLGKGIEKLELAPKINEYNDYTVRFIGICSKNREEYVITDFAASLFGFTCVPIYDTLGEEAVQYIFDQTNLTTLFCSNDNLEMLLHPAKGFKLGKVKQIVVWEPYTNTEKQNFANTGIKLYTFADVVKAGEGVEIELPKISSEDIAWLSYTSGTTGKPKAVMLTHGNFIAALGGKVACNDPITTIRETDVYLSYLPMAHSFEKFALLNCFHAGACVGFFNGDQKKIKDDITALKPTFFTAVPKVYDRLYDAMMNEIEKQTGIKKILIDAAISAKTKNLENKGELTHTVYDTLVFSKMKEAFGGRIRFLVTGAAAMAPEKANFFKVALSCPMVEGYGQTETCAGCFATHSSDQTSGHVGGPFACAEFKLIDVPDMKYTAMDKNENGEHMPRGEICVRGYNIFKGYYKEDKKTKETFDEDGWLLSGDIGTIDKYGRLTLIDRKKNIFKLSQGEYIAPEKVESVLLKDPLFAELCIYGDSKESYCILIAAPEHSEFKSFCSSKGLGSDDLEKLCEDEAVLKKVQEKVEEVGKAGGLKGFEIPKKVILRPESFAKDDMLTATTKVKRNAVKDFYKDKIEELYKEKKEK